MKKIIAFILIVLIVGLFLVTSNNPKPAPLNNKFLVVTSFYPMYFFSSEIGGEKADVKNITPAGSEPHDYEPTTQDFARIQQSKLLVLNGGVEAWANKVKDNLKGKNVKIVIAGEGQFSLELDENGQKNHDPHIWLDPRIAINIGDKIMNGYLTIDPGNEYFYSLNFNSLVKKLDQLDQDYKKGLSNCKSKEIITSHSAFGYLAKRYGLNQVSIAGLSPDSEPSQKQLADVAKFAKDHNVKYIFFESLVSPKLSETIAQEIGAKTLVLDPLEGLTDNDIMSGKNYFTVMENNLKNLQIALECTK